jgi:hypothetical protein
MVDESDVFDVVVMDAGPAGQSPTGGSPAATASTPPGNQENAVALLAKVV